MDRSEIRDILAKASVPEHSVPFMRAMSEGEPFVIGDYLFFAAADWLVAIGYPLAEEYQPAHFDQAVQAAVTRSAARNCWAVCPALPERLQPHRRSRDSYYILPLEAEIPVRLNRLAERASATLRVEQSTRFTSAHRRLWAEFTVRKPLPANVQELFARTEDVLARVEGLSLINAWDPDGNLAAALLVDEAPARFTAYLLGAHSRVHYTPYAADLLFREMILAARKAGKKFLHLGLGINSGITRFKTKWGGRPAMAYESAEWSEEAGLVSDIGQLALAITAGSGKAMSKREFWESLPQQRPFSMLWEIEKDGRRSWIGGTAHFFCYSFEASLRKLYKKADVVLFEGPLDQASLDSVVEVGRNPGSDSPRVIDHLSAEEIRRLERVVCGPRGFWAWVLGCQWDNPPDVRHLLADTRHWMAFFSLWSSYLARQGWNQSVDMEAWRIAREMGKPIHYLENITAQVATLERIPMPRVVNFLSNCGSWNRYIRRFVRAYLKGDLESLYGTSVEFPTRTEGVINLRDAVFLQKMKPFIESGSAAVFVGSAHMVNLRRMLADEGFRVRRTGC
ncbi:TraB/GumN family protein [Desulfurivibrio sp. C05AmB]|uniref:TraB/GumN family protein n=1 Tax=Desulfurivibrio sp. C05AmB TaxID=3374371 RepID=UPI00376EE909